ncbi:hypothetical protein MFRU_060g00160 [Monilinia fructicola]|uniref:NUDE domain-containing protein n=1 Tax=Monilinia fructicola TaxID=38448 RepID=A0A5M9JU42_MONFR|nr:hypothetical protein EYC84_002115 [Monilinia fructicola]KAG4025340.1 hypothetical protein MFRU_060g00160 [Monilinia fructicola]
MSELPSSPPSDPVDAIAYYKLQYEQLETELTEFQASSQELEAELEKDVEAAERRERLLQEKVESLGFEVEEWKTKYKQSKNEANAAQNKLQKEITSLRDANRTMQLQLRDIEVQHDDIERQARNTFSSLEDMESKFNMSIERGVMMEEEIKIGEKEREQLRIETQRLRDELSDLKVEADIMQGKLRKRQFPSITTDYTAPCTPSFEPFSTSPRSTASSPLINTPPDTKSISTTDTVSETPTPPSPPMSEASATARTGVSTPMNLPRSKLKLPAGNSSSTPKPAISRYVSGTVRSSRGTTPNGNSQMRSATPAVIRQTKQKAPPTRGLPNSTSLTHIRSLTAQMQRLEQRVQSARSKLPAPVTTPPHTTTRTPSAMGNNYLPPSLTVRGRKRTTGSTASLSTTSSMTGEETSTKHAPKVSVSGIGRLSFGPAGSRDGNDSSQYSSRPGSRASGSIYDRPPSRSSAGRLGAKTPIGSYSQSQIADSRRARSSIGGSYADRHGDGRPHTHSQSVSHIGYGVDENRGSDTSIPIRRGTVNGLDGTSIPMLSGLPRRKSGGQSLSMSGLPMPRRTSTSHGFRADDERMAIPKQPAGINRTPTAPTGRPRRLSGVGECY